MSSIFFRRQYYLKQLKKKELKKIKELFTKDDQDERVKVSNHLDLLREFTYLAVDNHNYRAISENCDYLIETVCFCEFMDEEIRLKTVDTIRHILDYMYTHNEVERIIYLLTSNSDLLSCRLQAFYSLLNDHPELTSNIVDSNTIVSYEIADWTVQDISRLGIWKTLKERIIDTHELLYCFINYFRTKYYPFSIVIEKGKEDDARSIQTHYDDVEKIIRLRRDYEKFILNYATFALRNDLSEELEVIIENILKEPDLIKACPKINILLDPNGMQSSIDLIFNLIDEDDHLLSSFITAYSTVVFMAKYEDVVWDCERDEKIVDQIMTIYNKKTDHAPVLNDIYETFMCEFVPASSEIRKKYVERLAVTGAYQKLISVISYDHSVYDTIHDQIDEKKESYYRIFLYLKNKDCSIVVPFENVCPPEQDTCSVSSEDDEDKNVAEIPDNPETVDSIKTENDSMKDERNEMVLKGVRNSLIKMEFRPTGKNRDEMIEFWNDNIRNRIPQNERDVLDKLDKYVSDLNMK